MRIKAFTLILRLKQCASHRSLMLKSKLTSGFEQDLRKFLSPSTNFNTCITKINESLDENWCSECENELGNTVILKCGHVFCIDCSVNMIGENCKKTECNK